jgi:hypothetical protein
MAPPPLRSSRHGYRERMEDRRLFVDTLLGSIAVLTESPPPEPESDGPPLVSS